MVLISCFPCRQIVLEDSDRFIVERDLSVASLRFMLPSDPAIFQVYILEVQADKLSQANAGLE